MNNIREYLTEFGVINGLLILGIILTSWLVLRLFSRILKQHQEQLQDRQHEIDRLAKDNREYRDRFLALLDKKFQQEDDEP